MSTEEIIFKSISSLCTVATVVIASVELYSRSHSKKSEKAINIYSSFLLIDILLKSSINDLEKLKTDCSFVSVDDYHSFANTHLIDKKILEKVHEIENEYIMIEKLKGLKKSNAESIVLPYIGKTLAIISSINLFYSAMLRKTTIDELWIRTCILRILNEYDKYQSNLECTRYELKSYVTEPIDKWSVLLIASFIIIVLVLVLVLFIK